MSDVVIRPSTLEELSYRLEGVNNIVALRNSHGWPLFMDDEVWEYTATFENSCDVCIDFHNRGPYSGPDIPQLFPQWVRTDQYEVWPRVHQNPDYPFLYKRCRCRLTLIDPMRMIKERLIREIEAG